MSEKLWKYHLGFFSFVALGAARSVFSADLLHSVDPLFFTFVIALCVMSYAVIMRTWTLGWTFSYDVRAAAPSFLLLGCTSFMGIMGNNLALDRMSPVLLSLIDVSLYPVMTSLIAYWFSRQETIHLEVILPTLLVAIVGIGLFSAQRVGGHPVYISAEGLAWEIVSIVGWAASIVVIGNLMREGTTLIDVIGVRFAVAALALGVILLRDAEPVKVHFIPRIAIIALGTYFLPFILSFSGLKKLSVVTFALYTMLSPVLTYLLNAIVSGEWALSLLQVVGMCLIFTALSLRTYSEYRALQVSQQNDLAHLTT